MQVRDYASTPAPTQTPVHGGLSSPVEAVLNADIQWGGYAKERQQELSDIYSTYREGLARAEKEVEDGIDFGNAEQMLKIDEFIARGRDNNDEENVDVEMNRTPEQKDADQKKADDFLIGHFLSEYITLSTKSRPVNWKRCGTQAECDVVYNYPTIKSKDGAQFLPDTFYDNIPSGNKNTKQYFETFIKNMKEQSEEPDLEQQEEYGMEEAAKPSPSEDDDSDEY